MLLSFKTLSEKKTKVKINPKMNDVMEGGMPITMHPYAKGGKVKKAKIKEGNHGEDCDCMQCESKRRKDDVNDGPDVQNEAKVDKGRSDYGKASIRNYRRMGPGHGDPGMFDPSGKRGKTIEKRREEHKARRGVKGAKVPAYKRESFERFVECWKTHKKVGMKMKGGKLVNDCRPKNEEVQVTEGSEKSYYLDKDAEKRAQQKARFKAQNKEAAKERAAAKRRKERNNLRRQGKYGAVGGYYVTKHMEREGVETYIKNNDQNIYDSQKEVSNQSNQSSKNETSILSEKDTALDIVKKNIIAKYGKGAIMRKGSNQPKKVRGAKSTAGTGKYLQKAKAKAQLKSDAKEMGYGDDTKGYIETRARYGSKENMKKGKGLGT